MENGITLKRDELGNCRRCEASPDGEVFKGHANIKSDLSYTCTHMNSQNGWWLRIEHSFDHWSEDNPRNPDEVGELLCPTCLIQHNKDMSELLGLD